MSTRLQLVTQAGFRLGDQSTAFLTDLDTQFPFVLNDMASREAISELRKTALFSTVQDQENYDTAVITGGTGPAYPLFIEKLWISVWGVDGLPAMAQNDLDYERYRAENLDIRSVWRMWRVYPNESQLQVWPPVDPDHVGTNIAQLTYVVAPTIPTSGTEAAQIRAIFQEAVVYGLMARSAEFKDETQQSLDTYWQLYVDAVNRMVAHRFNHSGGRIPINFDATY